MLMLMLKMMMMMTSISTVYIGIDPLPGEREKKIDYISSWDTNNYLQLYVVYVYSRGERYGTKVEYIVRGILF